MYKASINKSSFDITPGSENFDINGKSFSWDFKAVSKNYFHIIHNNLSYRAELVKADYATKECTIKINGRQYDVKIKDKLDLLLEKMGMNVGASAKINSIKAPMPGLIIDLKVKAGEEVKAGQALLVLEAMKMENILKAPGDATVKSVKVEKGNSVEKGQVLIEF